MLGLFYIIFFSLYLFISVVAVLYAIKKAKQRGISSWKWGLPVGLVMYSLIFWDHLPTVLVHQYNCINDAGLTIHTTMDEWKKENPGVAETLTPIKKSKPKTVGNTTHYYLNERFDFITVRSPIFLSIKQKLRKVVDKSTSKALAVYVDYSMGGAFQNASNLTDYKFWLSQKSCEREGDRRSAKRFSEFRISAKHVMGVK